MSRRGSAHRRVRSRPQFGGSPSTPVVKLKSSRDVLRVMKQIHVWPNHIRVPHLDLVLVRPEGEPLPRRLSALARLGLDTRPENIEFHDVVRSG